MSFIIESPRVTDGELFTRNLESSLEHAWFIFHAHPERTGTLEAIIDGESSRSQFFGDYSSLDRLVSLSNHLLQNKPTLASSYLFSAQVNSSRHLFAAAHENLSQAKLLGSDHDLCSRIQLGIDQALGMNLELVLDQRLRIASIDNAFENLIPLGALLADLGRVDEAHDTYIKALTNYRELSPIGLAWAFFQLGFLWGELVSEPDLEKASYYYSKAVDYLPGYTHAAVHLAEIQIENGKFDYARRLLNSVIDSGDPEVRWRMSELSAKEGNIQISENELEVAKLMYEDLLSRHELAFADHAAEFYLGSGNDPQRALKLASANLVNRKTARAYTLAIDAAEASGEFELAKSLSCQLSEK
jgi:Tetratricopeptide repeat